MKLKRREFFDWAAGSTGAIWSAWHTFAVRSGFAAPSAAPAKTAGGQPAYLDASLPIERRVEDLLSRMTLEEKVAQTHALWKQKQFIMDAQGNFDAEKAGAVLKNGIGQITRASENKPPLQNAEFCNAIQKFLKEKTRLGIPAIVHEESLHGLMAIGATSFPQAIALASTWNQELIEKVFAVAAHENRSRGGHQALAPVLDTARDPRWGRTEETYGEDPYLVSQVGLGCVRGFQGPGPNIPSPHIISTAKHFAVHSQPESGENVSPGNYALRTIHENFFPSFKTAFQRGGAMCVMASYNEVDGVPSHANRYFLQRILRQEWAFRGFVVSDYDGITQLETLHHVVANKKDAAKLALETGVDVELPDIDAYATLAGQIRSGRIVEATLDDAVRRHLRAKFLLGLFENPYVAPEEAIRVNNAPAHRALALEAAHQAIIMLKNENGLLPLDASKLRSLAVIGPNAAVCHLGEYSGVPVNPVSILEGIKAKVGGRIRVEYSEGCKITMNDTVAAWNVDQVVLPTAAEDEREIAEAVRVARRADAVLLVIGGNEQTSREEWSVTHLGDRDDLNLFGRQGELVKAMLGTGKPVIVFLIQGRPNSINYVAEHVPAIFEGWYLGEQTGTAVADVIFGDYNPAGRLPITVPRSVGDLPVYYNYKPSAHRGYLLQKPGPLYPFGWGLSYTTFEYSEPRVSPAKIGVDGEATVSVDVTNTGRRAGDEVVQMYLRDDVSSITRPVKELRGFRRIHLKAGEKRTVEFKLTHEELAFANLEMRRVVEPGTFTIMVGPNSVDLKTAKLEAVAI